MYLPPPYIPPELQHHTYTTMPEPYRSEIKAWADANLVIGEARLKRARANLIASLLIVVPLLIATAIVLYRHAP